MQGKQKATHKNKAAAPNGTGSKKLRQVSLPGTTTPKDKRIAKLATIYAEKRDARIEVQRHEISAKQVLIAAMKEKGLTRYEDNDDDLLVLLSAGKDKLKVKPLSEADEDDEADASGDDGEGDVEVRDGKAAAAGEQNGANGHAAADS